MIRAGTESFPRGAADLNVHFGPDVVERSQTADESIRLACELGLAAVCLRSHTGSTVDLANALNELHDSIRVFGAVCLNESIGGINPRAVETALRTGARIVTFPTWSSEAEAAVTPTPRPTIPLLDSDGKLLTATAEVLSLVADAGVALDIGSALAAQVIPIIRYARAQGITRIIVSHPFYKAQRYSAELQERAVKEGATVEHCYMQFAPGYPSGGQLDQLIRQLDRIGPEHVALSSDSGKAGFPTIRGALQNFFEKVNSHFTEDQMQKMFVANPNALLGLSYP